MDFIDTEISTQDLSNMLINGFADEEGYKGPVENGGIRDDAEGLDMPHYIDDDGIERVADTDINDDPFADEEADADTVEDFRDAAELDDTKIYNFDGIEADKEQIVKAVKAYEDFDRFKTSIFSLAQEFETVNEQISELQYKSNGQIDKTIAYWQSVIDNPRTDDSSYRQAVVEIRNAEAEKRSLDEEYKATRAQLAQRKAASEAARANAMRLELIRQNQWGNDDFQRVGKYIMDNRIQISGSTVNTNLMLALNKAAMFDAKRNAVEVEASNKVAKALGRPTHTAKAPAAEDVNVNSARVKQIMRKFEEGHPLTEQEKAIYFSNIRD